jgi:transposase
MARSRLLPTETQWEKIAPLLSKPPKQCHGGRPWIKNRRVVEGILYGVVADRTCWRSIRVLPRARGGWIGTSRAFG